MHWTLLLLNIVTDLFTSTRLLASIAQYTLISVQFCKCVVISSFLKNV